jgi:hypothetical protein
VCDGNRSFCFLHCNLMAEYIINLLLLFLDYDLSNFGAPHLGWVMYDSSKVLDTPTKLG